MQNVRTIVATMVGTVPLDRDFGFSWEAVDRPLPVAQMLVKSAVYEAVQKYESRAVIEDITWKDEGTADTMDGLLHPLLTISLADGVDGGAPTVTEQEDSIMDADATTGLQRWSCRLLSLTRNCNVWWIGCERIRPRWAVGSLPLMRERERCLLSVLQPVFS